MGGLVDEDREGDACMRAVLPRRVKKRMHPPTHSTYPPTHPPTYSPTYPPTHPPTHLPTEEARADHAQVGGGTRRALLMERAGGGGEEATALLLVQLLHAAGGEGVVHRLGFVLWGGWGGSVGEWVSGWVGGVYARQFPPWGFARAPVWGWPLRTPAPRASNRSHDRSLPLSLSLYIHVVAGLS